MKVLAFAASLRKGSWNRKLIAQAVAALSKTPGVVVDPGDFREFEMPMYDGDTEDSSGVPAGGVELARRIREAGAVVIATPEYNGGIPGTLKNAIDWVSRLKPNAFDGKPILLMGTSPGALGAVRSLAHTRVPLEAMGAYVYPTALGISKAAQAFGPDGAFTDPKNAERVAEMLGDFLKYAGQLQTLA